MNQEKYKEDLRDIKEMMAKSSRFISLSGISGVFAGIYALIGAYAAYTTIYGNQFYLDGGRSDLTSENLIKLCVIAGLTIFASIVTGYIFTKKETKKKNQSMWDAQTKRLLINFAIPMVTGGLLSVILLIKGHVGIVAPLTLVFYGLALINASKYTMGEIRSLGIIEICLGLFASYFIGYGLLFWAIGFGVLHIVYGVLMHFKKQQ